MRMILREHRVAIRVTAGRSKGIGKTECEGREVMVVGAISRVLAGLRGGVGSGQVCSRSHLHTLALVGPQKLREHGWYLDRNLARRSLKPKRVGEGQGQVACRGAV